MNKILQTIRESEEDLENKVHGGTEKDGYFHFTDIQNHIKQSNIKLIESIIEVVKKVEKVNDSNGRFNACEEIQNELKAIIK